MSTEAADPWSFLTFDKLIVKPPITSNSVTNFGSATIAKDANSTRIIVHPRFPQLVEAFLAFKREHGSSHEKRLYETPDSFTWRHEVSRLIKKRPLVFMGGMDHTMLRDGMIIDDTPTEEWDRNGTDQQYLNRYLKLHEYLSYDEIMLGSLIGVSGPSFFINDGNRYNNGKPGQEGTFEERGIIIGLIGARFERPGRMDDLHITRPILTADCSRDPHSLTKIFQDFYGVKIKQNVAFDVAMYQARMRITIDILLLEANERAGDAGKTAYTYVVGLGLGVWQHVAGQSTYYIDAFTSALYDLELPHISTIEFAYISVPEETSEMVVSAGEKQGIKVIFSRRNPAEKLQTDELLVLSYAWDGNAFPGNEYWYVYRSKHILFEAHTVRIAYRSR